MYAERFRLDGKVAVITGAAHGLGLAIADAFSEFGATTVLADRDAGTGEAAAERLRKLGRDALFTKLDVTWADDVRSCMAGIRERHGRLNILVACAGIGLAGETLDLPDDHWDEVMGINLDGVFWCAREAARQMLKGGGGAIVTIGSISGEIASVPQRQTAFNVSKAGVHLLTKSLASEFADRNIRVNAIAPGYIETDCSAHGPAHPSWYPNWLRLTPMNRFGRPEEIASVALLLASDAGSYMTGSIVLVDGGYTAR
jgi:NAD(P)-dependent dehydrogenase (short-subunit alcohol dehydrogenase family)